MNKFLIPASQRMANGEAVQSVAAFGNLAFMGTAVVIAKDLIRGQTPDEIMERFTDDEKWSETAFDIADRAGYFAYLSPYIDSALKMPVGDTTICERVGLPAPSRFQRNNALDSIAGANFRLVNELFQFGQVLGRGDTEAIRKKGLLLLPYNTYFRLGNNLAEAGIQ